MNNLPNDQAVLDPLIAPGVRQLMAHGFETVGSCQGHLTHGLASPWIDIGVTAQVPAKSRRQQMLLHNLNAQARLIKLLDLFYKTRRASANVRLILLSEGIWGGFRLTNQGWQSQKASSLSVRKTNLACFRREFRSFASFLSRRHRRAG